ncbi:MAG: GtrA family protein [bacterium]|nr:GtrA family protein [bacterium]
MEEKQNAERAHRGLFRYQGARYLFTGISCGILELGLFQFLLWLTGNVVGSNVIAIAFSMAYNFVMSRKFSFKSKGDWRRSLGLFSALFIFNMSFTSFLVETLIETFEWFPPLAKLTAMISVACWNFPLFRKVIFI